MLCTPVFADVPEYTVYRPVSAIVLDGVLDEPDWAEAKPVGDFMFPWWTDGEKEPTEVKLLWTDTYLYIALTSNDKHIWADHFDTNSWTYIDDALEFSWDPDPEKDDIYYFFEMNCAGNLLCSYDYWGGDFLNNKPMIPRIASNVRGTVNNDADIDSGFTLEVAIRFSDYPELSKRETPLAGDIWRVNFNRCGGKTNYQYSQWSPTQTEKPNFHRPEDFGRLIFSDRLVTEPTAVDENNKAALPGDFKITGNFPNPFNPSTTIEYTLPERGFTELIIYNSASQKVRTLIYGAQSTGVHTVVWDGRDDNGLQVSSGIYICMLKQDAFTTFNSMTLIK